MYKRVYKQKGSRVYRGRYRLGDDPKIHDVALKTDKKHVALAKLERRIREEEEEQVGLIDPKRLRDSARIPIADHLAEYVAHLRSLSRSRKHLAFTKNRILRLCEACGWRLLRDISPDGYNRWAAAQTAIGPKTRNEYLGHISAFLTWLEKNGRIVHHCLKTVTKAETRGQERVVRRALTEAEVARLVQAKGNRGLIYFLAIYTGLRRGEIKALRWADLSLDGPCPFITVRAATSKNKRMANLPLVVDLAVELRNFRDQQEVKVGKVFRLGVPKPKTLRRDLEACGIPYLDDEGRRVDFHALRHTFDTMLNLQKVGPRAIMELMRHSDMSLSQKTYMDTTLIPLAAEMRRLPSPIASPKSDKSCQNVGKPVQAEFGLQSLEVVVSPVKETALDNDVPAWESPERTEREGFEPSVPFRVHMISNHAHSTTLSPLLKSGPACGRIVKNAEVRGDIKGISVFAPRQRAKTAAALFRVQRK
jgi:integrase